jgi:hypothetical protein
MRKTLVPIILSTCLLPFGYAISLAAPQCTIQAEKPFGADVKVRLARATGLPQSANFGLFNASMAVNTDGAPTSYHPDDFVGQTRAINRIDNGIAIRRVGHLKEKLPVPEQIQVFDQWRAHNWTVPSGYKIFWQNVIAPSASGLPCIFSDGPNKGYFGSLTALKNDLPINQWGECQVKNQLDQRFIPAIVLRGDSNPLKEYGARKGDLVVAINPQNGVVVPAVIGDTGDGNRIGEGSVALNMKLLQRTDQPKNYPEAKTLDTGSHKMLVAVFPGSRTFNPKKPFTADNISERVKLWAMQRQYGELDKLVEATKACAGGL